MPSEKRRTPRIEFSKKIQVNYIDAEGRARFEIVPAQDVSAQGCRVVLKHRCQTRTVVALSVTPANSGSATVRYQNPTPRGFVTGLEFLGGLIISVPRNETPTAG